MSSLEDRPLGKLFEVILNVLWQNPIEVWKAVRKKMDVDGPEEVRRAFEQAREKLLESTLKDSLEVRWGMNLCPLCNDDNIEKNGIAYVSPTGDGLEFNQCLNCRIGIIYDLEAANARMDTYALGLGQAGQFNGFIFFWDAIVPEQLRSFWPLYEVLKNGQWLGRISVNQHADIIFLPFEAMTYGTLRDAREPWTTDLPSELVEAVASFTKAAQPQIEVAQILK